MPTDHNRHHHHTHTHTHTHTSSGTFNWGIVTNGGLTVGGLAFLDEPAAAANVSEVLAKAAVGIQCPFGSFAPHGGWHEGSMYWQYVAGYAVATTEALRTVYGHDNGLSTAPGFNETALFRLYMNGPSQASFDFGDSDGSLHNSAAQYFMGYSALPTSSSSVRSMCAYEARRLATLIGGYASGAAEGVDPAHGAAPMKFNCSLIDCARIMIDYSAAGTYADIQALPTARLFKLSAFGWEGRDAIGFFRSAWSTEADGVNGKHAYLAFKAANGVPNHNDLDGGTFVFEAGGQRWGMDMAADSYNLPQYFTQSLKYRYGYYRKSTAGHNTLTFNNDLVDNNNRGVSFGRSLACTCRAAVRQLSPRLLSDPSHAAVLTPLRRRVTRIRACQAERRLHCLLAAIPPPLPPPPPAAAISTAPLPRHPASLQRTRLWI
jgi:hypothetical protein